LGWVGGRIDRFKTGSAGDEGRYKEKTAEFGNRIGRKGVFVGINNRLAGESSTGEQPEKQTSLKRSTLTEIRDRPKSREDNAKQGGKKTALDNHCQY
jgi:hypothetical protein